MPGAVAAGAMSLTRASSAASLARKPNSGGRPAIDAAARPAITATTGIREARPDSLVMSRVPVEWSMTPTVRNSVALNSAWASSIARPACAAAWVPRPTSSMMKPSWLTVP